MNPYRITEPTCISFSGGRTSGYMLKQILDAHDGVLPDQAIVCFANTGKEDDATLDFVEACATNWKVKINWLEFRNDETKFAVVDYETASRNGEPFEALIIKKKYLPNPVTRFCTIEMKIRVISKFCKSVGMDISEQDSWVGIRADEPRRVAKIGIDRLPLVRAGITAVDVGDFWKAQAFDLQLPNINGKTMHGNCDLCFLKGGNQVLSLITEKPERAIWWAKMETLIASVNVQSHEGTAKFRKDRPSYSQMLSFSNDQADMFSDETIECYCGD